jgi:hypothetical protein
VAIRNKPSVKVRTASAGVTPPIAAQPMAREWYALMLLDRNATGDRSKARDLLTEALAMYERWEMPFHANRTSGRCRFSTCLCLYCG